ncbi:MAG: chitobiase/beta-hexosaminidase C-terminal domain-containing protein [Bacteroidales bacterium]|nr:chitobiase/beta-hexosaminidase C-terminal domain-containing protein [Bacteroidales bacterium]
MRRRFTVLLAAALLLMSSIVWGQTRVEEVYSTCLFGGSHGTNNNYTSTWTATNGNFSWSVENGNTNGANWNYVKFGRKNTESVGAITTASAYSDAITKVELTIDAITAAKINSIKLYSSSNNSSWTEIDEFDKATGTQTVSITSPAANLYYRIEFDCASGSSNGFVSVSKVEYYYNASGTPTVATPTFSPAAGTYSETQNVTISCATTDATIYYTTNGTTPTTSSSVYSSPITISETTTVKAMGVKTGMDNSSVATATYTIQQLQSITTIAGLWEFAATAGSSTPSQPNANVTFNDWYVTGVKSSQVCVSDGQYGFVIYQSGHGFVAGDKLSGTVACKVMMYQNHYAEVMGVKASDLTVVSGQEVPVLSTAIASLEVRNYGTAINLGTCSYNGSKFYDAAGDSITLYNNFNVNPNPINSLEAGKQYNVKGVSIIYWQSNNQTQQIAPRNADDFEEIVGPTEQVATPTFTPAAGEYSEAQTVTIACTTQGATIHYTLDGTTPTTNSSTYTAALTISETTTVKAIAVKADMIDSEIATATYTINIVPPTPVTETSYKLITNADALISGDKYIIVGIKGETYKALGKQATNNRPAVTVTPSNDTITVTPAAGADEDAVYELTLGQEGNYWTLYDAVNGGYLYAASSSANYLKVQAENNANGQWTIEIASNGVATIKAQGANTRNWLRLNSSGSPFSCYGNGQLDVYLYKAGDIPTPSYYTVSVAEGITNGTISVDTTSNLVGGETITVTATPNQGYELSTLTYTYAGVANPINIDQTTMQFTMPSADVTVNATFTELAHVANPTFTPTAGSFITAQQVSIACTTEGATIHYTIDGTDPTTNSTVYSEAFTVSTTTTVKAMAVKTGLNNSDVVSATYTIIEPMTIAEARALANNEYALVQGVVTFIDGRNIYAQDATAGIDLYLNNNTVPQALAIGDMVMAYGKKTVYNGLVELTSINGSDDNQFIILSSSNPLPVVEKTIAEILADHSGSQMLQSTRVQIVDATVGTINNNNNTPITQGENTLNIYKMPVVEGLEEGDIATVIGVIGCYNNPQLRVASAADVTFAHPAGITVTPTSLAGFTYVYEEGPSTVKTFTITGRSLTGPTVITAPESYEMSSFPGENFYPESQITINTYTGSYSNTIKVRLKAGLEIGDYNEEITITEDDVDDITIALTGSVTDSQPTPPAGNYVRVSDLSQLTSGSKVIFAARYNETANEYYAMTAQASGKPEGVLFTSVAGATETLPSEISDAEETYYWTVDVNGENYTFTNANGDVLGYNSSTNFANGGDNTAWAISFQTSEEGAMVPNYSGFVVNNVNVAVRAIALNSNHNFGPYHTQNLGGEGYNFFLDMFATVGGGTLTCAAPTFAPEGGTYYEAQEVALACSTADATIYYTLDGTDPTENSSVYTTPIAVAESMTIKAIAMKEGYENSTIATAEYTIILGAVTIFQQDWEGEMNGWTFVTVEGSNAWTINQYQGNHYAYANGYNGGVNEQWCISPAFDLNVYSNANLTFRNAKNYTGPAVQLLFSSDYDGENPSSATWTELEFNMSTGSYAWVESGVIDLADYTGSNCYIGFKYTCTETEAAAWEIDDIMLMGFTTDPYLTVTPNALSGFTHHIGEGPSASQTFVLTAGNISPAPGGGILGSINVFVYSPFEISLDDEEYDNEIFFDGITNLEATTIYVRMNGTEIGQYTESVNIYASSGDEATVTLSGTVTEEPIPGGDWNRIYALSDLNDGDQIILAARYDASVGDGYYAMTAGVSGKPDGVLFTSVNNSGAEQLPAEIADDADTYLWNVTLDGNVITLTNAAGDALGYSSSTNFAGNENIEWNIALETSSESALIPNYTGFVITNGTTTNRGIAKNASNKFGAYATSNMNNTDYNFYLDIFVMGGTVTPVVATPVISVASGTYYEEFDVEITCATEGATIYYTTDGTEPTAESSVYTEPIHVAQDMTLKAIAMMEGYENSGIATADYVIHTDMIVIFNQDWEGEMDGWTFVTIYGNKPWTIATHNGNKYANANGYNDDVDNDQWCISPAFNLNNYEGVTLTFMNAMKFTGPDLELYFSNNYDGQDPTTAMWQRIDFTMSEGNYIWTESGEISLNSFSGSNCYLGFRYTSTIEEGAASWEIDDIVLTATSITSVNEVSLMEVNVWNYDNEIFVENNTDNNVQLSVFNVLGQQVLAKTVATGSVRFTHNLAKGMYIVTLQCNDERKSGKIIVR